MFEDCRCAHASNCNENKLKISLPPSLCRLSCADPEEGHTISFSETKCTKIESRDEHDKKIANNCSFCYWCNDSITVKMQVKRTLFAFILCIFRRLFIFLRRRAFVADAFVVIFSFSAHIGFISVSCVFAPSTFVCYIRKWFRNIFLCDERYQFLRCTSEKYLSFFAFDVFLRQCRLMDAVVSINIAGIVQFAFFDSYLQVCIKSHWA